MLVPALAAMLLQAAAPAPAPASAPAESASSSPAATETPTGTEAAGPSSPEAAAAPAASEAAAPAPAQTAESGAPAPSAVVKADTQGDASRAHGKTLWLMQPLYPGQELIVGRTEEAIANLLPAEGRGSEVVGRRELSANVGKGNDAVDCIFGETRCQDPMGALVSGLGFDRVVLVRVGQEGTGYRVRAASFQPGSAHVATAESEGASLEKALLSSVVRVAPLAALVEVRSEPSGATVFIDGEKVGVTPLSTQVLPGERTIRMEYASFQALEKKEQVPVRGKVQVTGALTRLPGKLHVVSSGARIFVDGEEAGQDEVELATTAGVHRVSLHRDGYEPYETDVEVKPDGTSKVEHELDPTFFKKVGQAMSAAQSEIYEEDGYFSFVYEQRTMTSAKFGARIVGLSGELDGIASRYQDAQLHSFGVEYGSLWGFVGMTWFGASYFTTSDDWVLHKAGVEEGDPDLVPSTIDGGTLRLFQPQLRLALWRFVLGVRGGVAMNLGVATGTQRMDRNKYAFGGIDAEAMGTLQLRIVGGLYGEVGFGRSWEIVPFMGEAGGSQNLRFGVGYAY